MGMMDVRDSNITNTTKNSSDINAFLCTNYPESPIIWAAFAVPAACVGVPAAMWLLWVLIRKQHQQQRSGNGSSTTTTNNNNIYMLNLTIMDLIFNVSIPFYVFNDLYLRNDSLAWVVMTISNLNVVGRPLSTVCICADCYVAVVHPIIYMKAKLARWRQAACAVVWVALFVSGIPSMREPAMLLSLFGIPFLVSLPPIVFFNASILRALQRPDPAGRSGVHPQKQRAMRTISYSLVVATVAYLPPIVLFGSSLLLQLTYEQMYCLVATAVSIPLSLLSALMPVFILKNLGHLSHVTKTCCCE